MEKLIDHLNNIEQEVTLARHNHLERQGRSTVWYMLCGGSLALTASLIFAAPKHWLTLGYVGGSVSISLAVGASIENNRANHWRKIAATLEASRPLPKVANDWLGRDKRRTEVIETPESSHKPPEAPLTCPALELATNPVSSLIGGVSGSGKSLFTLAALNHLTKLQPNLSITFVDPKFSPLEKPNLPSTVKLERFNFTHSSVDSSTQWLLDIIDQHNKIEGPKLLVIDELASVLTTLKLSSRELKAMGRFRAFVSHVTSMGASDKNYLWLVTQDVSTDTLGISSSLRAQLQAIALVSPHNRNAVTAFMSGGWVPKHPDGLEGLELLMDSSPVNRAYFSGKRGKWFALPKIENLTGNDRDNPQLTKGFEVAPNHTSWFDSSNELAVDDPWNPELTKVDESPLSYLEIWEEWLANCGDSEITVRYATQYAPRNVRGNTEETKAVFKQLAKAGIGEFDGKILRLNLLNVGGV